MVGAMQLVSNLRRVDLSSAPRWQRPVVRSIQFLQALWGQVQQDKLVIRASGLAYSTLIALVPLVAVIFSLLAAFGTLEELKLRIESGVLTQLVPTRQDEIAAWLNHFIDNANRLGFFGFVFLIVTAILLLDNIESNFNDIWNVSRSRSFISKITSYTSVLVFGSVLLGASLSISARLKAILMTNSGFDLGLLTRLYGSLVPLLLSFLAFLLMYLIIPFVKVGWRNALTGAVVASVLWETVKSVFASSVGQSVQYSTIYGSLAAVPIFLIWLYITWIIVLLGLEITFVRRNLLALIRASVDRGAASNDRLSLVLRSLLVIGRRFENGEEPALADELAQRFQVSIRRIEDEMGLLVDRGFLLEASIRGETGLVPGRAPDRIRVVEVIEHLLHIPDLERTAPGLDREVAAVLQSFREGGNGALGDLTLRQMVERLEPEAPLEDEPDPGEPSKDA